MERFYHHASLVANVLTKCNIDIFTLIRNYSLKNFEIVLKSIKFVPKRINIYPNFTILADKNSSVGIQELK